MSNKICPECGASNPSSEEMCDHCGFSLDTAASSAPAAVAGETCSECGKAVSSDMRFCDGCGAALGFSQSLEPEPPKASIDPDKQPVLPTLPPLGVNHDAAPPVPMFVSAAGAGAGDHSQPANAWKLTCVEGFHIGKEYLLFKDEMLLGRTDAESDIYPDLELEDQDDGFVSRRHACLRIQGKQVTIEDLGGENGTLLDGRPLLPLKPTPVGKGQVIRVGKVGLQLKVHEPRS